MTSPNQTSTSGMADELQSVIDSYIGPGTSLAACMLWKSTGHNIGAAFWLIAPFADDMARYVQWLEQKQG